MSIDLDQLIRGAIESTTSRGSKEKRGKAPVPARPSPQVSLMPVEIKGAGQERRVRTVLVAGVAAVALLTGAGVVAASSAASDADARAAAAATRQSAAAVQLGKFRDVQTLQQRIQLAQAAERVGSSTAIDWQRWQDLVLADMPLGYALTSFDADSATPFLDYPQGTSPLDAPRAATITVTATTRSIDSLPNWLRQLKGLPAFGDLVPTTTSDGTAYTVQIVIHLTTGSYITPLKGTK